MGNFKMYVLSSEQDIKPNYNGKEENVKNNTSLYWYH